MKPKAPFHFTVEGTGTFPFDMLRYDQCWPRYEAQVSKLASQGRGLRRIDMVSETRPPTEARWASFGWDVVSP